MTVTRSLQGPLMMLLALGMLVLASCTTALPRERLPWPIDGEGPEGSAKVVVVPLPVIASSPNEGLTLGALSAFLLHNRQDEVNALLAPQINYNANFGTTVSWYGALYPTPEQTWEFNLSRSTHVNEDYEVRYIHRELLGKKLELNLFPYYFTDGSARFFGFQSASRREDETNYADREFGVSLAASWRLSKNYRVVLGERVRKVSILPGAVSGVPFIRDRFSAADVPGIDGFTTHAQRIALVYSTLNSESMPTSGGYARAAAENSSTFLGSSANFRHYEIELKAFLPKWEGRSISALRLAWNKTSGADPPFLEQSILGGETSLRGYGRNRFIDKSYFLLNLEERFRLFRWEIFDITADWELAPFLDMGSVMKSLGQLSTDSFEFNPGVGFRATVPPNIIGRVDVGFGSDGPAVFVGLGYPF